MSLARKVFFGVFLLGTAIGLIIGIIELVAPEVSTVTLNDQDVTGMTGFWTALVSGAIPGLIIGLIAAGITKLVTRKKAAAEPTA
ncbi:MAG: hypothetical protein ACYC0C_08555 [Devosia sp.]